MKDKKKLTKRNTTKCALTLTIYMLYEYAYIVLRITKICSE